MVKTTHLQKMWLILFGVLLSFIIIEAGLRTTGFAMTTVQEFENRITENKEEYRILCLGESTTANLQNGYSSWPEQLENILNSAGKKTKFKVINEGVPGVNTGFILLYLKENLDKYKPDMIITMMGIMEMDHAQKELIKKSSNCPDYDSQNFFSKFKTFKLFDLICFHLESRLKSQNLDSSMNRIKEPTKMIITPTEDALVLQNEGSVSIDHKKELTESNNLLYTSRDYLTIGQDYSKNTQYKEAEEAFKKAISINSSDYESYNEIGWIYASQMRLEEAEKMLKTAISLNPGYSNAYVGLGDVYQKGGRLKEAEEAFKKGIEIDPKSQTGLVWLGLLYQRLGSFTEAEIMFKRAVEANPKDDWAYAALGWACKSQGKTEESKEAFKNANNIRISHYIPDMFNNYQEVYKVLSERNIRLAVMDYPNRDIQELKNIFNEAQQRDIIFINNLENFKKFFKQEDYGYYFTDRFGGDFGHCTLAGNRLIAENVAETILKEMKII